MTQIYYSWLVRWHNQRWDGTSRIQNSFCGWPQGAAPAKSEREWRYLICSTKRAFNNHVMFFCPCLYNRFCSSHCCSSRERLTIQIENCCVEVVLITLSTASQDHPTPELLRGIVFLKMRNDSHWVYLRVLAGHPASSGVTAPSHCPEIPCWAPCWAIIAKM